MKLNVLVAVCCVVLVPASPAAAQHRVYYSLPPATMSVPSPFQTPDASELAKALTGTPLPSARSPMEAPAALDSTRRAVRTCPMLVLVPDTTHLEHMPFVRAYSTRRDSMPVVRPACSNPLRP